MFLNFYFDIHFLANLPHKNNVLTIKIYMILKELKVYFKNQLFSIYPEQEIDTFFSYLIEDYLNLKRIDTVIKPNFEIVEQKKILFKKAIKRLKNEEPIQYVLGKTEFYGFPFLVNKNTLIPRPETEELVAWILAEISKTTKQDEVSFNPKTILEIGTGTGCIPISLKKKLSNTAIISAIDISKEALNIAQENAKINAVEIQFIRKDILNTNDLNFIANANNDIRFDIIVSNPPYVRELEKSELKNNVLENEPHLALFVSDTNPLIFYDKIADLAKIHLNKNGLLFFEINQYLAKETIKMLANKGFKNIVLKKDFLGNNRMLKANL